MATSTKMEFREVVRPHLPRLYGLACRLVGDRAEDAELAQNAGIDFIWADQFFGREQA